MAFEFDELKSGGGSDPTADFLQREKLAAGELLGGDAQLFGGASAAPASADDEVQNLERNASQFPALDGEDQFLDAPAGETAESVSVAQPGAVPPEPADPEEQFRAHYPDLGDADAAEPPAPQAVPEPEERGMSAMPEPAPQQAPAPAAPAETPLPLRTQLTYDQDLEEESEPLRKWREAQADDIARRDAQAERQRGEIVSAAEQEIDQFYAEYNAQKEKNIKRNKENEARFHDQKTRELAEGTTWTRVTKLLDLQNSQSKTIAKVGAGSTDLTRMKELYLSLRREGETAPGASGY